MRRPEVHSSGLFLAGFVLAVIFTGCSGSNSGGTRDLEVTVKEAYLGVKDGNVESVPLPDDRLYLTVDVCIQNISEADLSVRWEEVYLTSGDTVRSSPAALGYDQAEAFSWVLPLAEPIGGKRINHAYYFFLIQGNELLAIPARQSLGCGDSFQFKSLALLFLIPEENAGGPFTLHIRGAGGNFETDIPLDIPDSVRWAAGVGLLFILTGLVVILLRRRKRDGNDV